MVYLHHHRYRKRCNITGGGIAPNTSVAVANDEVKQML
jgi:hypothetical protein